MLKKRTIIITIIGVLLIIAFCIFCFLPKPSNEDILSISIQTQLLNPMIPGVSADKGNMRYVKGHFQLPIYTYNVPRMFDTTYSTDRLVYKCGKIDCEPKRNTLELNIREQSFYESNIIENYIPPTDPGYYYYYLSFDTPQTLEKALSELSVFYTYPQNAKVNYGITWLPVKTSDKKEDITIGMRGNLTSFESEQFFNNSQVQINYLDGLYQNEISLFKSELNWLTKHIKKNEQILKSGIWGEDISINYSERKKYITDNGCYIYGAYVFGDEDLIRDIPSNMSLRFYCKPFEIK